MKIHRKINDGKCEKKKILEGKKIRKGKLEKIAEKDEKKRKLKEEN